MQRNPDIPDTLALPAFDSARLLTTFLELVRIDSPSGHEKEVAHYCKRVLEACGCSVVIDDTAHQTGSDTGNLIATLPGTKEGCIYVSAHMDTVEPGRSIEPVITDGVISSAGDTILGGDDKVGLAAILETLQVLAGGQNLLYPQIKVLLTVQEEQGLIGAQALDARDFKGEPCYVLDAAGPPGSLVIGAPSQRSYTAEFIGTAAHAGINPAEGNSAIKAAAMAVMALPFGRLDEATTTNIGTITGGIANNIVAERCTITGECRSHDSERLQALCKEVEAALFEAATSSKTTLNLTWVENYESFSYEVDDPFIARAREISHEIGLATEATITGGGADTNVFVRQGLRAVSLATGMQDVHGTSETLAIQDLEDLSSYLIALILLGVC